VRRIIGDLSDRERVLIGLDLLYDELTDDPQFDELALESDPEAPQAEDKPDELQPPSPPHGERLDDGLNPRP
jgi:circadian clock protein KaiB